VYFACPVAPEDGTGGAFLPVPSMVLDTIVNNQSKVVNRTMPTAFCLLYGKSWLTKNNQLDNIAF